MSGAEAMSAPLPPGDYAIVEVLGKRTYVGRVSEVERFGAKFVAVEPLFDGALLPVVLIGGASIYQFTPVSAEVAAKRQPRERWQLPPSVSVTLPAPALTFGDSSAPDIDGDGDGDGEDWDEDDFAPAFLTTGGDHGG